MTYGHHLKTVLIGVSIMTNGNKLIGSVVLALAIAFVPNVSMAAEVQERPSAGAMTLDALVARPVGAVILGAGAITWVATLPFSLAGGNAMEAGDVLVVGPARETFYRCLGCSLTGRKQRVEPRY